MSATRTAPPSRPSAYGRACIREALNRGINSRHSTPRTIVAAMRQAQRTYLVHDDDFDAVVNESLYYSMLVDALEDTDASLV